MALADDDLELLDTISRLHHLPVHQANEELWRRYGNTTRAWQVINRLIDNPNAQAHAPVALGHLRRRRDQRLHRGT